MGTAFSSPDDLNLSAQNEKIDQEHFVAELFDSRVIFPASSIQLMGKIGAGNSGQVMQGELDGMPCALKLTNDLWFSGLRDESAMDSFRREVKILLTASHPNVLRLYGVTLLQESAGTQPDNDNLVKEQKLYMVTELCMTSLAAEITTHRKKLDASGAAKNVLTKYHFKKDRLLKWMNQVSSALAYLHRLRLLHGDIKPDNVLVDHVCFYYEFQFFFV